MSIMTEIGDELLALPVGRPRTPDMFWPFGYGAAFLALLWCCMTWHGVACVVGGILTVVATVCGTIVCATRFHDGDE